MNKLYKTIIFTFIYAFFSFSICAVESLKQLCTKKIAKELTSDTMFKQFRNNPNFIQEKGLNLMPKNLRDLIKDAIFSYIPSPFGRLNLGHWILHISKFYSPDGRFIARLSDNNTLEIHNLQNDTVLYTLYHNNGIESVNWSPDGKYTAITFSHPDEHYINILNLQNGTHVSNLDYDNSYLYPIGWLPNGKHIITYCPENYNIQIWDIQTGTLSYNPIKEDREPVIPSYIDTSLQLKNLSLEQTLLLALVYHDQIKKERYTHNALRTILKRDIRAMDDLSSQSCSCKRLRK